MCVSVHTTLYFNRYPTDCAEKIPCTNTVHEDKQSTRPQGAAVLCDGMWERVLKFKQTVVPFLPQRQG